ncbi:hypothetical protein MBLNU457_5900t1 [Dothideomycetes sp. NU457]
MAKVAKSKKTRAVSVHSRAARRAASPSAGIDRSLENATGAEDEKLSKKFLSPHAGGITKKKKSKPMTRQQRVRQEKGMQRAEADMDKLATKVTKSHKKAKTIKSRAATWEELNKLAGSAPGTTSFSALQEDSIDTDDDDEDEDKQVEDKAEVLASQPQAEAQADEEVDEVL